MWCNVRFVLCSISFNTTPLNGDIPFKPNNSSFRLARQDVPLVCAPGTLPRPVGDDHPFAKGKDCKQHRHELQRQKLPKRGGSMAHCLRRCFDFSSTPPIHQGVKLLPELVLDDNG